MNGGKTYNTGTGGGKAYSVMDSASPASLRLPLLWDGAFTGTVEAAREGLYLRFRVQAPARSGVWTVRLYGSAGSARLGVLEPLDGQLTLDRRLSLRSLSPLGRLARCEIRPADGREPGPPDTTAADITGEPSRELRRLASEAGGVLFPVDGGRLSGRGFLLVVPQGERFPLPSLFCFARGDSIGGRPCWVFPFDRRGNPVF